MEEQRQLAREADYKAGIRASLDAEAASAAQVAGAPLLCIGLVLRDPAGEFCWFNGAHGDFAAVLQRCSQGKIVAALGVTEERSLYVNMQTGQDQYEAEVTECFKAILCTDPPKKDMLCVARLSRGAIAKHLASGKVTDSKVLAELGRVPEYVEHYYCRMTGEGSVSVSWDEPSAAPSLTN
jgi:hypothetical protein